MADSNRVVITGMGIYSTLGQNLADVNQSLQEGRSGIRFHQELKDYGYRSGLMGMLEIPKLNGLVSRRDRVGLAQQGKFAYMATNEALDSAGLDKATLKDLEAGILYGNDSTSKAVIDAVKKVEEKKDTTLLGSGAVFQCMNSNVSMNLATMFGLTGVNFTISGACASGSHSIGMAYLLIKMGLQKLVVCGGAQEVNKEGYTSFDGISAFSMRESEPEKASRPFDKDRDGLIPSGGAATVIVESLESAKARGANILAEIIGYGFSSNGEHISKPNKEGQLKSLNNAIKDAQIDPKEIDYVNAHATSTVVGDSVEAEALGDLFEKHGTPVSSTKSMTGHECWMAGASEIVYSLLMMQNNFIAPNINFENPDEASKRINVIAKTQKNVNLQTVLSNSFGFGGTNSTLLIRKTE